MPDSALQFNMLGHGVKEAHFLSRAFNALGRIAFSFINAMPRAIQMYCRQTFACFEEMMPSYPGLFRLTFISLYMGLITLVAAAMPSSGDFVFICGAIGFTPLDFVLAHLKALEDSVQFKAPAARNSG
nr:GABA transporter 1-like [Ipomoea batatas]